MKTQQKGFTLIELMIVIAIIGILASVALPAYREYIINSKLGAVAAAITGVQRAVEKEHSRKGDGILVSTTKAIIGTSDADFVKVLGMRAKPLNPDGVSAIALVVPSAKAGTCIASVNYKADTAISNTVTIAGASKTLTGGAIELTLNDGIDANLNTKKITFSPVVTKSGISWKAWSDAGNANDEISELACRWLSENVNGGDGTS
ncbi:MAG: prepilin-type N-terminal cleavage/methylation domain-containing protein [Oleispira sp.]|jgi:prepilin-type N-terminal cleavage/methylation domain-containing protein